MSSRSGGPKAQGLDEQHLDEALEDQVASRTAFGRFIADELYDPAQPRRSGLAATDEDARRQEPHEQLRVRVVEAE